jgi:predicted RNA-binding protein with PIN domain
MPIVIDGYNLYHALLAVDDGWRDLSRTAMCRYVAAFVGPGSSATIVFDGAWPNDRSAELAAGDVAVTYSGPGREADEVIEHLIAADSAPRRLLVVSSDRRIRKAAAGRGCRSVKSEPFAAAVYRHHVSPPPARQSEPPEKRRGLNDLELAEAWMDYLGLVDEDLPPSDFPWR